MEIIGEEFIFAYVHVCKFTHDKFLANEKCFTCRAFIFGMHSSESWPVFVISEMRREN